jgi:hypothetical protein
MGLLAIVTFCWQVGLSTEMAADEMLSESWKLRE